jgi:lysozyme
VKRQIFALALAFIFVLPVCLCAQAPMSMSGKGLRMLMLLEGRRLKEGRHVIHGGDWNGGLHIGYGHRLNSDQAERFTEGLSESEAFLLLKKDAEHSAKVVRISITIPLQQHEFDALVIFAYNVGPNAFRTSDVVARLNANDRKGAMEALRLHIQGKVRGSQALEEKPGLIRRRAMEQTLFENREYVLK